jgi:cell division transport system permease protein
MKFAYSIHEAIEGFRRARISSFISICTIAFLLVVIAIFGVLSANVNRLITVLHAQIDIQVFIVNTLNDTQITDLAGRIKKIPGVAKVEFVSKDMAAKEFQKEFGQELFTILEENPLPSTFLVALSERFRTAGGIEKVAQQIQKEAGVDEVEYHGQTLNLLNKYARIARIVDVVLIAFVTLGSLFLVANTIRLIIIAKKEIIETMKLVGATRSFIRRPLLIEGVVQGTLGGIIAFVFVYLAAQFVADQVPGLIHVSADTLSLLIVAGFALGLLGSAFAVKKYL